MEGGARMKYSVPPFSGPRFHANMDKGHKLDATPCAICGCGVAGEWKHVAVVVNGGAAWGDDTSPEDAGYMGRWPIGSDCHRKYAIKEAQP